MKVSYNQQVKKLLKTSAFSSPSLEYDVNTEEELSSADESGADDDVDFWYVLWKLSRVKNFVVNDPRSHLHLRGVSVRFHREISS